MARRFAAEHRAAQAESRSDTLEARANALLRQEALVKDQMQRRLSALEDLAAKHCCEAEERVSRAEQRFHSGRDAASTLTAELRCRSSSNSPRKAARSPAPQWGTTTPRSSWCCSAEENPE